MSDSLPSAFRSRRRSPITSAESDRAREFFGQRFDFLFRPLRARNVSVLLCEFQFLSQLGEPAPIGNLGLIVEHLARVAESGDMDAGLLEVLITARQTLRRLAAFIFVVTAGDSSDEIEHVELHRGIPQQMGDISESASVLQTKRFPGVANGPILGFFPEDSFLWRGPLFHGTDARYRVASTGRSTSSATCLRCHLKFSRPLGQFS